MSESSHPDREPTDDPLATVFAEADPDRLRKLAGGVLDRRHALRRPAGLYREGVEAAAPAFRGHKRLCGAGQGAFEHSGSQRAS